MVAQWARQLGRNAKKFFGRTLAQGFNKFGRQLHSGVKLLPQAFKDTSKVYSNLERKTHGIPVLGDMFGFASKGTQAVGDLLSGNFGKAQAGGLQTLASGKNVLASGTKLGADVMAQSAKYAPYFA